MEEKSQLQEMSEDCCNINLIRKDGEFNVADLQKLINRVKLAECGVSYVLLSILGPQSSGKSTLLNQLFHTIFKEMDASVGRSKTTEGIWITNCSDMKPCTLILDLEGTDGRERGEATAFEKKSVLFSLVMSDIVLINMWCHDIGRKQAANIPLLNTVFQVMIQLFGPRKTTLVFVIRDKTKEPLESLKHILMEDIQKIWDSIPKPEADHGFLLGDFFNIDVAALPSYEEKEEQFKEQIAKLREGLENSIAQIGLANARKGVVPGAEFLSNAKEIWEKINANQDLNLPTFNVMVALVRCDGIAKTKLMDITFDDEWINLEEDAKRGVVSKFGEKVRSVLNRFLSEYDIETFYFDEATKKSKREQLESDLLQVVHPACQSILDHVQSKVLKDFKEVFYKSLSQKERFADAAQCSLAYSMSKFDRECQGLGIEQLKQDCSIVRAKLWNDIQCFISIVRSTKILAIKKENEEKIKKKLQASFEALLNEAGDNTWRAVRELVTREVAHANLQYGCDLQEFEPYEDLIQEITVNFQQFARNIIENKAMEEAHKVGKRMTERFENMFFYDPDSMPRDWNRTQDITAITKRARLAGLKMLSVMTISQLDDETNKVDDKLLVSVLDQTSNYTTCKSIEALICIGSNSWSEDPNIITLLTPADVKSIWNKFLEETNYHVLVTKSAQESSKTHPSFSLRFSFQTRFLSRLYFSRIPRHSFFLRNH